MAIPYFEDWAAGNSTFSSMYRYDKPPEAADPLYPFIRAAEGVYINGDGRLDKNPAYTGPFQTYQQAGIWFKGMGPLTSAGSGANGGAGFWDGTVGCIQCTYYPTTESLAEIEALGDYCPVLMVGTPQLGQSLIGASIHLEQGEMLVEQSNDGSHPGETEVTGVAMPVAGEPYVVRMGWQCGTYDEDTGTALPDGFLRIHINGELMYEAVNISLLLSFLTVPGNLITSVLFGLAGLLGPLDQFTISDSACVDAQAIQFKSGMLSTPLAWSKILLKVT
jgi:hypothetical protein